MIPRIYFKENFIKKIEKYIRDIPIYPGYIFEWTHRTKADHAIEESKFKTDKVYILENEVKNLKQELIECSTIRKSEGTAFLEVEHLKADNDRLIKLLQSTKEYKNFSKFALDNLGSVRFMPATKRKKCAVKNCGANTIIENVPPNYEEENWIPQEAFDTVI